MKNGIERCGPTNLRNMKWTKQEVRRSEDHYLEKYGIIIRNLIYVLD
jgi:hypothetical protein